MIRYSELFSSFQGEGTHTGKSTIWLRLFGCNLQCDGFGQKDPTDHSTYILPYKDFDASSLSAIEQLPVWQYGCDSSYTWAKKYKHLMKVADATEIARLFGEQLRSEYNPDGKFLHPKTGQDVHLAFTGGEPMLSQDAMVDILVALRALDNLPRHLTIETNGTVAVKEQLACWGHSLELFWSVSPKLFTVSGEVAERAIKPDVVARYATINGAGHLKFVVDGSERCWDELEGVVKQFRDAGVQWDVFFMCVGATKEDQESDQIGRIVLDGLKRGYHFSGRLHAHIFKNTLGT